MTRSRASVYDAIRLARGCRAGGLIFVLACYLDDSDAVSAKALTIAGYVAHDDGWMRFEIEAERICKKYGVELIRGRQIDGRKDCFKGWSLPKCEQFLDELGTALVGSCRAIQMADLYAFYSRRRANQFARFRGKLEFVPDIHKIHVGRKIKHDTGFIENPFITGTNQRTGETFNHTDLFLRPGKG